MSTNQTSDSSAGHGGARPEEAAALEALRTSEIRYRRLFESAKDGILILDAETGMVMDVNPYLLDILGYSRTEVLQKKVWELGFLADVVANEDLFAKLRQTKYVRYDNLALEGHDGRRHEVEFVSNVYPEGSHEVIQCNVRDVSERKRSEARVHHLMQVLKAIRNGNQLIVHEEDPRRMIARACENLTETLGYHNAWIALLDDKRTVTATASAGFDGQFDALRQRLARGACPSCMGQALELDTTVVVDDPPIECADCPLARAYGGRAGFTRRLAFENATYGILAVSVPATYARDSEAQDLFDEVAGDIGFALHKIELRARLSEAEARARTKLNTLLAPEGNIGDLSIADALDVPALQTIMNEFYGLTGMGMAILDMEGHSVATGGWQDICARFHRVHPETLRICTESTASLVAGMKNNGFNIHCCGNSLYELVTPIMLGQRHAGNLFLGQFLIAGAEPDREIFRARARQYGFDEAEYLAAFDRLPRISREQVKHAISLLTSFAKQISDLNYGNIRLARILAQRDELMGRLGQNEERLRLALKATNDVVWDWDILNDAQRWNETGANVFGWTDIVEAPQTAAWWLDRIHPEDRQRVHATFFAVVSDPDAFRWDDEYRFRKANGEFAHIVDRGHILRDAGGQAIRMIGAMMDVTERKRAEDLLREERERLEYVLHATGTGVDIIDGDFNLHYVDKGWQKVYGDPTGRKCYEYFDGLSKPCPGCAVPKALETKQFLVSEEVLPRENNRPIEVRTMPFQNSEGKWMVAEVNIDITDRRCAEAERESLQAQLRQAQKMESIGRLAGGVAHDFNNILTGIGGYTELALNQLDAASPVREDLTEVKRLARRAADLTRQLLAFSRRQPLEVRILNINEAVEDASKMLKRVLGEDISIQFAMAPDLGNVRADAGQIEQVLLNLAVNARDAMPAGGKLMIETANIELGAQYAARHVAVNPGPYVMLAVSDTGCGLEKAAKENIFEPFFTTKPKGKGTGLGLSTVYGIVKQHGGNIWVYSEPGKGASFKIYLPRVAKAVTEAPRTTEPKALRGNETLLVVEDEEAVRTFAQRALEAQGYTVVTAASAEDAERLFYEAPKRFSLLLTDVVLPGMNGRTLYERLKASDETLKVLYMSGYTDNAIVNQGVLDQGTAFMQKPFTIEMAALKVRRILDS